MVAAVGGADFEHTLGRTYSQRRAEGIWMRFRAAMTKSRVLILCTGNAARSQMAEGLLRALSHGALDVVSAGIRPTQVHPLAIRAMQERGIEIRHHRSKSVSEFAGESFDYVITVCDAAAEACPTLPGSAQRIHWSLPDPATATGSEDERLVVFRRVRNALETRLREWMATLPPDTVPVVEA
jgi:arsenate reductase